MAQNGSNAGNTIRSRFSGVFVLNNLLYFFLRTTIGIHYIPFCASATTNGSTQIERHAGCPDDVLAWFALNLTARVK